MGESSKSMEPQLQKAMDEAEVWRKTCRELEGHFLDIKCMEYRELELERQLEAHLDLHYINNNQEPPANVTDEKKNVCFDSTVESVIAVEREIAVKTEGSLVDSLVLLKHRTVNTLPIKVIDIDSEKEVVEEGKELPHVSTAETSETSQQCLKRPLSPRRDEEHAGKVVVTPFCSAQKRCKGF